VNVAGEIRMYVRTIARLLMAHQLIRDMPNSKSAPPKYWKFRSPGEADAVCEPEFFEDTTGAVGRNGKKRSPEFLADTSRAIEFAATYFTPSHITLTGLVAAEPHVKLDELCATLAAPISERATRFQRGPWMPKGFVYPDDSAIPGFLHPENTTRPLARGIGKRLAIALLKHYKLPVDEQEEANGDDSDHQKDTSGSDEPRDTNSKPFVLPSPSLPVSRFVNGGSHGPNPSVRPPSSELHVRPSVNCSRRLPTGLSRMLGHAQQAVSHNSCIDSSAWGLSRDCRWTLQPSAARSSGPTHLPPFLNLLASCDTEGHLLSRSRPGKRVLDVLTETSADSFGHLPTGRKEPRGDPWPFLSLTPPMDGLASPSLSMLFCT
jgi:hypothetical protein